MPFLILKSSIESFKMASESSVRRMLSNEYAQGIQDQYENQNMCKVDHSFECPSLLGRQSHELECDDAMQDTPPNANISHQAMAAFDYPSLFISRASSNSTNPPANKDCINPKDTIAHDNTLPPWSKAHLSSYFFISLGEPAVQNDWDVFVRDKLIWHPFWSDNWNIGPRQHCCNKIRVDMLDTDGLDATPTEDGFLLIEKKRGNQAYDLRIMMARNDFRGTVVPRENPEDPWVWRFEPSPGVARKFMMPAPLEDLRRETNLEALEREKAGFN